MKRKKEEREQRLKQRNSTRSKPVAKKQTTKNNDSAAPTPIGPSTQNKFSARKKRKVDKSEEAKEDADECVCSFCFGKYADDQGNDWIRCACSRWVHEECAEDVIVDAEGLERFCPFCTSLVG